MKGKNVLVLAVLLLFASAAPALAGTGSGQVPGLDENAASKQISQEARRAGHVTGVQAQQPPVEVPEDLLPEDLLPELLPGDLLPEDLLPGDLLPEDLLPGDLLPPPGGAGAPGDRRGAVDLGPGRRAAVAGEFLGRGAPGARAAGADGGQLPVTGAGAGLIAAAVAGLALVTGGLGLALRK